MLFCGTKKNCGDFNGTRPGASLSKEQLSFCSVLEHENADLVGLLRCRCSVQHGNNYFFSALHLPPILCLLI